MGTPPRCSQLEARGPPPQMAPTLGTSGGGRDSERTRCSGSFALPDTGNDRERTPKGPRECVSGTVEARTAPPSDVWLLEETSTAGSGGEYQTVAQ